ncbi:LysR substrate-binding domain-containing protein [Pseudomonas sp. Z18(2022)]|uniref:LysR substrate-binding domain-containing protein n=1 Tax=Pseudomonas sp. Z18(2022) TaxID=2983410 RepID=UPI002E8069D8|nr:LysR substrate-binding domain-containing protein [Pseudomonas sp. Z18(2022)]
MNLRQLSYFISIVEEGSFSRAAKLLHIAQPALSQQLINLEVELGAKLLLRSVKGVTPTATGKAVLRQAQLILKQVETARLIASQAETGPAGPVKIGLPWTISSRIGIELLVMVTSNCPAIQLEVIEGPSSFLANLLAKGSLDMAVLFDNSADGGMIMTKIATEPMLFVAPHGSLPDADAIALSDVMSHKLLLLSRPNGVRETLERIWKKEKMVPNVVAEINSPHLLLLAVSKGLGGAILPKSAVQESINNGEVDGRMIEDRRMVRHIYLSISRLEDETEAAEHVHSILEELIRQTF